MDASRAVPIKNHQSAFGQRADVVAHRMIQYPHTVEVILLPVFAVRINLLFVVAYQIERRMAVESNDEMELRSLCLAHFLARQSKNFRVPNAPRASLCDRIVRIRLKPNFVEIHPLERGKAIKESTGVSVKGNGAITMLKHEFGKWIAETEAGHCVIDYPQIWGRPKGPENPCRRCCGCDKHGF